MSDLESVDLSQESDSEASEDRQLSPKPQSDSQPKQNDVALAPPKRPPRRQTGVKPTSTDAQNGTMAPGKSKEGTEPAPSTAKPTAKLTSKLSSKSVSKPASKSAPLNKPASQPTTAPPQKTSEKVPEKPAEPMQGATKPAPAKGKRRGRPRKIKEQQKPEDTAVVVRPAAPAKPATTVKSVSAPKPATAKPSSTSTPADGEAPRPTARGRKRRLAVKPIDESPRKDDHPESAPVVSTTAPQRPQPPENAAPQQRQPAKSTEKKLHGAAKAAVEKRRRELDEAQVTVVPSKQSRGKRKDIGNATADVTEVPASSAPQKGRPAKRARRQSAKEPTKTVSQEVIRIEDDESDPGPAPVVTSVKDVFAKPSQSENVTSRENANSILAPTTNAAISRGRQSLPLSFARPAVRKGKGQDAALSIPKDRPTEAPAADQPNMGEDLVSRDIPRDTLIQTQIEAETAPESSRPRRYRVRHSTGNIGDMDMDIDAKPEANKCAPHSSNSEAVKSLLDEIQRNAIPFLLSQDRICDSFATRIGEDVDKILKNADNDVFEVFSERMKDALVADRLKLAVASAKTDLRRGIEKLLREFARKVGAPFVEADTTLLLRNAAFPQTMRFKEERRVSKHFAPSSPKVTKPLTPPIPRRVAEESNHHEDASEGDDLSNGMPVIATPRRLSLAEEIHPIANSAELKKFVGYSYENLGLHCYRSCAILKLCAQPGGMTAATLYKLTPLGVKSIKTKVKDLVDHGYLVEDIIRDGEKHVSIYSTAAHVSDT